MREEDNMFSKSERARTASHDEVVARSRELTAGIRESAAAAEEARTIPRASVDALLGMGIARVLIPSRFGGYGLGFDTWLEVLREIGKADASHAWCASLMLVHPFWVAQFAEEAQKTVWADGPDISIASSILPYGKITAVKGGYNVSGQFPFSSGINHSPWVIVGGMVETGAAPQWTLFLLGPGTFKIVDTWNTAGMRATGSNTVVCDGVFVPMSHSVCVADLVEGEAPGSSLHSNPIYGAPLLAYAPWGFVAPMLGAAQGAYELFRETTKTKRNTFGEPLAAMASIQVRTARSAADLDAAELLMRRAAEIAQAPTKPSLELRARSGRDAARASEMCVDVIDTLIGMSGTAGFAATHPIQRAWRDIHFAAMHVSLNPELNFGHFGRCELGIPRDPHQALY
jgi:3-hydroxy-9,10-secoandrosta-1,3,5(10)-triene-9,17-dione monooxygenase